MLTLLLASCGGETTAPSGSSSVLIEGGVIAEVSPDQSLLSWYANPIGLSNGPFSGALHVTSLVSGTTTSLSDAAFDANFRASTDTLYFFERPAWDARKGAYTGALSIWTPRLTAPVALSSNYVPRSATTDDHSVTVYLDAAQPNEDTPGDVKLLRTGECAGTTCPVQTLATNLTLSSIRMSADGRYAEYDTRTALGGGQEFGVVLVSVATGTTAQVALTTLPSQVVGPTRFADFSADGALLATITTLNGTPMQLQVVSTATGAPVAWGQLPAGTLVTSVKFADASTLYLQVQDTAGNSSVYRTTATSAAPFATATQFFVSYTPAGAERYFFFSTTPASELASGAPFDLQMLDLSDPIPVPVVLSSGTRSTPALSNDLSALWFLAAAAPGASGEVLLTAALPSGTVRTVSEHVDPDSVNFGGGTNHLFYALVGTLPSRVQGGLGAPFYVTGNGGTQEVDPDALRWNSVGGGGEAMLYVTGNSPLRIYREPLP